MKTEIQMDVLDFRSEPTDDDLNTFRERLKRYEHQQNDNS